jgi:hypothetical protein
MPFKSEAQRRFLFAKHPQIAKRWAHESGTPKNLPEYKRSEDAHTKRAITREFEKRKK